MIEADENHSREYEDGWGDKEEDIAEVEEPLVPGAPLAPGPQWHHTRPSHQRHLCVLVCHWCVVKYKISVRKLKRCFKAPFGIKWRLVVRMGVPIEALVLSFPPMPMLAQCTSVARCTDTGHCTGSGHSQVVTSIIQPGTQICIWWATIQARCGCGVAWGSTIIVMETIRQDIVFIQQWLTCYTECPMSTSRPPLCLGKLTHDAFHLNQFYFDQFHMTHF